MARIIDRRRASGGFTLVELLIYMALAAVVGVGLIQTMKGSLRFHEQMDAAMYLKENMRASMNFMVRDIRRAGADPRTEGGMLFGLTEAQPQSIRVTADFLPLITQTGARFITGNGDRTEPGEDVRYYLEDGQLMRQARYSIGGPLTPEVVMENVTDLQFKYYSNDPFVETLFPLQAYYVEITLEGESNYVDVKTGQKIEAQLQTKVYIRNKAMQF